MRLKLKELRTKNNLSVADMAIKLGVSTSYYYKIESGIRNPTISLARQICIIIGGNIDVLFFASCLDQMSNGIGVGHSESA